MCYKGHQNMNTLIDLLLEKKRDRTQEISIYFFENCNLRCSFCWQDHETVEGLNTVREKVSSIEAYFKEEKRDSVSFAMMGGELFSDKVFDDQLLDDFKYVTDCIKDLSIKYNKKVKICWVTNLVTTKLDKIKDLLAHGRKQGLAVDISTSYDFAGRFNINQFLVFKTNVEIMWDEIGTFSLTMTRANCKYFLEKKDPYFDYLYNKGAYFYFDYYMPDQEAERQCPTDTMLYEVFKKGITEYPRIDPWKSWLTNSSNYASCRSSRMINPDNSRSNCGAMVIAQNEAAADKIYTVKLHNKSNAIIENHFLEKYNCIGCEYVERCSFGCFMQHASTKFVEELDDCVYRKTYKFMEQQELIVQ